MFVSLLVTICCILLPVIYGKKPLWQETSKEWTHCSKTCDAGIQYRKLDCIRIEIFKSQTILDPSECKNIPVPKQRTSRPCNLGDCNRRYIWKVTQEGTCSQTCGNNGYRFREVICLYIENLSTGEYTPTETYYCPKNKKPDIRIECNRYDCPPDIAQQKWKPKCFVNKMDKCEPGRQFSFPMECTQITSSGSKVVTQLKYCIMQKKIPSIYRQCFDHANTEECLKRKPKLPQITLNNLTVVQMRRARRLSLQVGQIAHVIPWTKLVVNCPVNHFRRDKLTWKQMSISDSPSSIEPTSKLSLNINSQVYSYQGKGLKNRIQVDKKGRLRISKFYLQDQGKWSCMAGKANAQVTLKMRSPSAGFNDWAARNKIWNEEMQGDNIKNARKINAEVIQWISTPWSTCSVTCDGTGLQLRTVKCEKVDTRYYQMLEDSVCQSRMLPKPESERTCNTGHKCPKWVLEEKGRDICTDNCVGINKGRVKANLTCSRGGDFFPYTNCDSALMPLIECDNPKCQVKWNISEWSKCSQSCGSQGIEARHLTCVWLTSGEPAGSLCYIVKLPIPEVVRPCNPPPCRLQCLDLSPYCSQNAKFCRYTIYMYQCCKSCTALNSSTKLIN